MQLSDKDKKRIGENIKAIRKANGLSKGDFASLMFVSESKLDHIESGDYKADNWDEAIMSVARFSGFSFTQIKEEDLTKEISKNDLNFDENISLSEIVETPGFVESILEIIDKIFPFESNEEALKSKHFNEGMAIVKKLPYASYAECEIDKAIECFNMAYKEDKIEAAIVNILSCLGLYFLFRVRMNPDSSNFDTMGNISSDNWASIQSEISEKLQKDNPAERKKAFLSKYGKQMDDCITALRSSKEYQDYLYYFIMNQYVNGMLDENEVKMDTEEMFSFGINLLKNLIAIKNKYALAMQEVNELED